MTFPFPFFVPSASVIPAVVSYIGLTHNTANVTTYTETGVAIGAAATGRHIFVAVTHASSVGTARTVSSATIGGVSATIHAQASATSAHGLGCAIISALLETGTTATIAVTLSGTGGSLDIGVYRVTGLMSATAHDFETDNEEAGGGILSCSIDVPAAGFVIGAGNFEADSGGVTWVGAGENYDESNGDGSPEIVTGAMSSSLSSETGRTVSASHETTTGNDCCMCVASWA